MVDRPAFPSGDMATMPVELGMTLRDYFAAKAMAALIDGYDHEARMNSIDKNHRTGFDDNPNPDSKSTYASLLADEAYLIADAMLAERQKQQ